MFQDQQPGGPMQSTTPQELSPVTSPSPSSRQYINLQGIKSPTFAMPGGAAGPNGGQLRAPTPAQTSHDFQQPATPDPATVDPYAQQPSTPKPGFAPRLPDPYAHQPGTPRPSFGVPRPQLQVTMN